MRGKVWIQTRYFLLRLAHLPGYLIPLRIINFPDFLGRSQQVTRAPEHNGWEGCGQRTPITYSPWLLLPLLLIAPCQVAALKLDRILLGRELPELRKVLFEGRADERGKQEVARGSAYKNDPLHDVTTFCMRQVQTSLFKPHPLPHEIDP